MKYDRMAQGLKDIRVASDSKYSFSITPLAQNGDIIDRGLVRSYAKKKPPCATAKVIADEILLVETLVNFFNLCETL